MKKLALFLSFLFVISCSKEKDPIIYTLTTSANPTEGGTVSPSTQQYDEGQQISITAAPAAGFLFDKWTGAASGSDKTVSIIMDSDKSVTANFVKTFAMDENGIVKCPDASPGDKEIINGKQYEVIANREELLKRVESLQDVTCLCTTLVTDMSLLIRALPNIGEERSWNQDISSWDVSNVTNMDGMFLGGQSFNANISKWDTSNVSNMQAMFQSANAFNQDISKWDVSNVITTRGMFYAATSFNQDIGSWDVGKVTQMRRMFNSAQKFNQDISNWNVSNVTDMSDMFFNALNFNQNLSGWDVSKVTNCTGFSRNVPNWSKNYQPNFQGLNCD